MKRTLSTAAMVGGGLALIAAVFVTLFAHWEPSGETWSYWFFSRIFAETGTFNIPGRSPMYALYLELFRWMGYPLSVSVEYVVTTLITGASLLVLFRRYFHWAVLVLLVVLWVPFFQVSEPPVQKLALACACFGVALRERQAAGRLSYTASYAFFVLATMFRGTYVLCVVAFLLYDVWMACRSKTIFTAIVPRRQDWPLLLVLALLVWFNVAQSTHRWNGCQPIGVEWTPTDNKSLGNTAFIQNYNRLYILDKYKSLGVGKDWYFTNKEAFGGAQTMGEALKANPKLVLKLMAVNFKNLIAGSANFTLIPRVVYKGLPQGSKWWYFVHLFITLPVIGGILYGAFRGAATDSMRLFLVVSVLMMGVTVLALPRERYFFPLIPLLLVSVAFYLSWIADRCRKMPLGVVGILMAAVIVVFFAKEFVDWAKVLVTLRKDVVRGELKVLDPQDAEVFSMRESKTVIEPLIQNCHGIMSSESIFFAAHTRVPVDRFFVFLDLPPSGTLADSTYKGLTPDKIDCVLVSHRVPRDEGAETNERIRYDNYVRPYVERLEQMGAVTYEIPAYGRVTILDQQKREP